MKTLFSTLCIMTVSLFVLASPSMAEDKKEKKEAAKVYSVGVSGVT
jgi:hypothetical protein